MSRPFVSLRQTRTTGVAPLWAAAWLVRAETPTPSALPPVRNLILMIGAGKRVGILTSVPANHATPASFYAQDHETGGLALLDGYVPEAARAVLSKQRSSASKTNDDLKRCIAEAKRSDDGTAGWATVRNVLSTALGIKEADCAPLEKDHQAVLKAPDEEAGKALDHLLRGTAKIRDAAAGLAWTTGGHTATDVPLWAFGPGSERSGGVQDNTQVFARGKALLLPSAP